jgi:hypothetical protein
MRIARSRSAAAVATGGGDTSHAWRTVCGHGRPGSGRGGTSFGVWGREEVGSVVTVSGPPHIPFGSVGADDLRTPTLRGPYAAPVTLCGAAPGWGWAFDRADAWTALWELAKLPVCDWVVLLGKEADVDCAAWQSDGGGPGESRPPSRSPLRDHGSWKIQRPLSRSLARMYSSPVSGCIQTSTPQKLLPPASVTPPTGSM